MDCHLGRQSCSLICKAVIADRNGNAVLRWCLDDRNRTKPYVVFRTKWLPVRRVPLALGVTTLGSHGFLHCKGDYRECQWAHRLRCVNVFADLRLQNACSHASNCCWRMQKRIIYNHIYCAGYVLTWHVGAVLYDWCQASVGLKLAMRLVAAQG